MRYLYLVLALLGAALPLSQFVPASIDGSLTVTSLLSEAMATRTLRGLSFDLLLAAITGIIFMVVQSRREGLRHLWAPLLGTLFIGFSFGLPLFLYLRERGNQKNERLTE